MLGGVVGSQDGLFVMQAEARLTVPEQSKNKLKQTELRAFPFHLLQMGQSLRPAKANTQPQMQKELTKTSCLKHFLSEGVFLWGQGKP